MKLTFEAYDKITEITLPDDADIYEVLSAVHTGLKGLTFFESSIYAGVSQLAADIKETAEFILEDKDEI